ncbi:hypothetical protein FPANT_9969 [Fusarium pseudoanthophilum]|uniref:Uncharacterized protein n=1 Tax=Fusarium pseudoanthophilum TaxID=48495 RepID=A0A8H5KSH1_9HYPO|nr:hypothetical protein FPANT_9969 [Fusarium pseudoanthophilum]
MAQLISGYIAASLAGIGDLNDPLDENGSNSTVENFDRIFERVEEKLNRIPLEEQYWSISVAIKDNEPVLVVGIVYQEGERQPVVPAALRDLYQDQVVENLPLMVDEEIEQGLLV